MNYLAHLLLAGDAEHAIVGGLMGDFVRGSVPAELPAAVRDAIAVHRRIDAFTDRHPIVAISKRRLRSTVGPYAGIVVDVFYDHVLASDWQRYSHVPLRAFAQRVYAALHRHHALLPERLRVVAPRLAEHDVLTSYGTIAGIRRALQRISQRARRPITLDAAVPLLERDRALFAEEFHRFFPELTDFCAQLAPLTSPPWFTPSARL